MTANTLIHELTAADEKQKLIIESLALLRAASVIDERESLRVADWTAWAVATVPHIKAHKELATAMEIELLARYGALIEAEGERRGGDMKSADAKIKVEQRPTLIKAARDRRYAARTVHAAPEAVREYVQATTHAGKSLSVRGAVRAAKKATTKKSAVVTPKPAPRVESSPAGVTRDVAARRQKIYDQILKGGGTPHSRAQWAALLHTTRVGVYEFFSDAELLPWVIVETIGTDIKATIDEVLRAHCRDHRPHAVLGGVSVHDALMELEAHIAKKQKELHDLRTGHTWRPDAVNKLAQSELIENTRLRIKELVTLSA